MECKGKSKRMKEEAPSKRLPPKIYGGDFAANASTPTKAAHDEILSSLLRINNFDSSIKDESLDIDLSACVTISSASFINGNSLSSTDFWRVLDESAQNNTELNLSADVCRDDLSVPSPSPSASPSSSAAIVANLSNGSASDNHNSEFNVTFLRPEPPNAFTNSPFKKISTTPVKLPSPDQMQNFQVQRKPRLPAATSVRLKVFKEEPTEDKSATAEQPKAQSMSKVEISDAEQMPHAFTMFQQQQQQTQQPNNMPPPAAPLESNTT